MQRKIYFCKSWFAAKRKPTEIWTEKQAKTASQAGRPYTVLVDSMERPFCVLNFASRFVGIDFLDEYLRETLTYHFREVSSSRLFLSMATHREFESNSDKVISGTTYMFGEDGNVKMRREFFLPEYRLETGESKADVGANFSPVPEFGEYDEIIRIERSE